MNNLEEKILSTINLNQPSEGHRNRFENKLKESKSKKRRLRSQIAVYAASVAVLLTISLFHFNKLANINSHAVLIIETHEFIESEQYYKQQIKSKLQTIKELDSENEAILTDIAEFDESLQNLKSDLSQAPGDKRVVEAVLHTYMLKNEALDLIVNKLKNVS